MNPIKRGLAITAFFVVALMPTIALGDGSTHIEKRYQNLYDRIDKQNLGPYEHGLAGRNLVDSGVLKHGNVRPATTAELQDSISTMRLMIHPAPVPAPVSTASTTTVPITTTTTTTSSGGCPSYMAAEASSPSAVNPSSGAAGCYQILPSTQANYGCTDVGADCAARICADVGNAAWAASGSTPCDYLGQP